MVSMRSGYSPSRFATPAHRVTIDLRLIRHAVALAEHGSFSRAAEALGIAQPTLSRSIRDLEAGVGLPLFARHRHGTQPTDFGYVFLQQAAAVSAQVSDLEREVSLAKGQDKGELAVGLGPYAAELLLRHALPRFVSAHPAVRVRIQVDSLEVLGRALRQRALDLVVGESTVLEGDESIEIFEPLAPVQGYLFARAGHPMTRGTATLRDLARYPLIQVSRLPPRALRPLLEMLGATAAAGASIPVPAIECPTVPLAIEAVAGSDALMMASLGMVEREIARGRLVPVLAEGWMQTRWAFMKLRHRSPSPAAHAFLAELRTAQDAVMAEDARLARRWRARLPRPAASASASALAVSAARARAGGGAASMAEAVALRPQVAGPKAPRERRGR
jgi:DNA-binding transcriptional LysR family regulator